MKVVYVSGKYRDSRGPWYVGKNIQRAENVAMELWKLGFAVICPHKNTAFFEGPLDDPVIMKGDCELVRRSDALVVIPGWEDSLGTKEEWQTAQEANKPIFYWELEVTALRRWMNDGYDLEAHLARQKRCLSIQALYKQVSDET